jgi:hypothetical protein
MRGRSERRQNFVRQRGAKVFHRDPWQEEEESRVHRIRIAGAKCCAGLR